PTTPTSHTYTLSLHDALPILPSSMPKTCDGWSRTGTENLVWGVAPAAAEIESRASLNTGPTVLSASCKVVPRAPQSAGRTILPLDRKSTRLNSSHLGISYAVF